MSTATVYATRDEVHEDLAPARPVVIAPADEMFGEADFIPGSKLTKLAQALIADDPQFAFLRDWTDTIVCLWKRKGGTSGGKDVLGKCQQLSGAARHFAGKRYLIWLGADTCRKARLTERQLEALVYHELCHLAPGDLDDDTGEEQAPKVVAHDFAGFTSELARYGAWQADLAVAQAAFEELPLFASSTSGRG